MKKRLDILETSKLELEDNVFCLAKQFMPGYTGGCWNFSEISRYWYYLADSVRLCNPYNYFDGELSAKAGGIALSMMSCSSLSIQYHENNPEKSEFWGKYYYFLEKVLQEDFEGNDISRINRFLN